MFKDTSFPKKASKRKEKKKVNTTRQRNKDIDQQLQAIKQHQRDENQRKNNN